MKSRRFRECSRQDWIVEYDIAIMRRDRRWFTQAWAGSALVRDTEMAARKSNAHPGKGFIESILRKNGKCFSAK